MMTVFLSAWSVLKNAPVPNYAQPKQPSDFTAMEDERKREAHRDRFFDNREDKPYGIVERMPRPDMGHGESSFDSERMNTGTSVFNPSPSWRNPGHGPVQEMVDTYAIPYANRLNNMAGEMGATPATPPATPPTPPLTDGRKIGVQQPTQQYFLDAQTGIQQHPTTQLPRNPQYYAGREGYL